MFLDAAVSRWLLSLAADLLPGAETTSTTLVPFRLRNQVPARFETFALPLVSSIVFALAVVLLNLVSLMRLTQCWRCKSGPDPRVPASGVTPGNRITLVKRRPSSGFFTSNHPRRRLHILHNFGFKPTSRVFMSDSNSIRFVWSARQRSFD